MDVLTGGRVQLECETSEAHVCVCWYKDGKELDCQRFSQNMGTQHRLVASSVTKQDEGTYSCHVGKDSCGLPAAGLW